jgi:hypothetical protein
MATRETQATVYHCLKQLKRREDALHKATGFVRQYPTNGEWEIGLRRAVQETGEMDRLMRAALAAVEANIKPDDQFGQFARQMDLPFNVFDPDEFKEV